MGHICVNLNRLILLGMYISRRERSACMLHPYPERTICLYDLSLSPYHMHHPYPYRMHQLRVELSAVTAGRRRDRKHLQRVLPMMQAVDHQELFRMDRVVER